MNKICKAFYKRQIGGKTGQTFYIQSIKGTEGQKKCIPNTYRQNIWSIIKQKWSVCLDMVYREREKYELEVGQMK